MIQQTHLFSSKKVDYFFGRSFREMMSEFDADKIVVITDENVFVKQSSLFEGYKTIVVKAGEEHKTQQSVDKIIHQLLQFEADKNTIVVGVGGGVVTDMAGYAASIFKRGIRLIQVPTSVLAMVDAAVGGKNGVDVGLYKNMVGTIYQPEVILFDYDFLTTLPYLEWTNGFAEIIKHACIKDAELFEFLETHQLQEFIDHKELMAELIHKNVGIKTSIVLKDEFETGDRKLLNFGHTLGHAIENIHELPHGLAVSIGMVAACKLSNHIVDFSEQQQSKVENLLLQYALPIHINFNKEAIWDVLLKDKKRDKNSMNFILLKNIGEGIIFPIQLEELKTLINEAL